ncbi:MAG: hypothetical protein AAFP19_12100 [Bacteroidota bacterium]
MDENILDYFEDDAEKEFDAGTKIIAIKYFYFESQARLYAARLKEANIRSFVSNANTTTVLPFGEGGIGLHIRESDQEEALAIIRELDVNNVNDPPPQSFRDADEEDIAYERALNQDEKKPFDPAIITIIIIIIILLLQLFL